MVFVMVASVSLSCSECMLGRRWFYLGLNDDPWHFPIVCSQNSGQCPWAGCLCLEYWGLSRDQLPRIIQNDPKLILASPGHLKMNRSFQSKCKCWAIVGQWWECWALTRMPSLVLDSVWPSVTCPFSSNVTQMEADSSMWQMTFSDFPFLISSSLSGFYSPAHMPVSLMPLILLQPLRQDLLASLLLPLYLRAPSTPTGNRPDCPCPALVIAMPYPNGIISSLALFILLSSVSVCLCMCVFTCVCVSLFLMIPNLFTYS